jgi:hypothetical protein
MKNILILFVAFIFNTTLFSANSGESKSSFWLTPKKGCFFYAKAIDSCDFLDYCHTKGSEFLSIMPFSERSKHNFLITDKEGVLQEQDLYLLKIFLKEAQVRNLKVVLSFHSFPLGEEGKGFTVPAALSFWKAIAHALKDETACIGYNIFTLPVVTFSDKEYSEYLESVVKAIREEDEASTIVIEPRGAKHQPYVKSFIPLKDSNVLYAFRVRPEAKKLEGVPAGEGKKAEATLYLPDLPQKDVIGFLYPILKWAEKWKIPSSRIWVYDFRPSWPFEKSEQYEKDFMKGITDYGWHWSFNGEEACR